MDKCVRVARGQWGTSERVHFPLCFRRQSELASVYAPPVWPESCTQHANTWRGVLSAAQMSGKLSPFIHLIHTNLRRPLQKRALPRQERLRTAETILVVPALPRAQHARQRVVVVIRHQMICPVHPVTPGPPSRLAMVRYCSLF